MAAVLRQRHRLPRFVNRAIDDVAKNPDGFLSRVASLVLGGSRASAAPPPTTVPATAVRVYVGPTNYAGQGYLWARALEASSPELGARNMAVELPGGFAFAADSTVPVAVYNSSSRWQRAELEAVSAFTHVLFEAERPLFGRLLGRDVAAEIAELQQRGLSCAFLSHGTDIRSPRAHADLTPWSPFADDPEQSKALQKDADANLALIERLTLPTFVSTPDLLLDLPAATWCPVVVDVPAWRSGRTVLSGPVPIVAHMPSMGSVKGTHLIEPAMRRLHDEGIIDYRAITGIAASDMPALVAEADIVLDQFRVGSYGVAACEAMAAGRAVVGHIPEPIRALVLERTGLALPVIEADPDSLESVIRSLVDAPERARTAVVDGTRFVTSVHSGAASATALRSGWIDASR